MPGILSIHGVTLYLFDEVVITGTICSESTPCRVADMPGVVGSVDTVAGKVKVWPVDEDWPGLPPGHDGKLWFRAADIEAVAVVPRVGEQGR